MDARTITRKPLPGRMDQVDASNDKNISLQEADASKSNRSSPPGQANIQGGTQDILTSLAVIVIPMFAFTAVLLGLIMHYQVPQTHSALPGVSDPLARESSAFLVDFSASRLLTVASWTSTVSALLPSFAMLLYSYPVSRSILNASKDRNVENLPTPYQLSLLLGVLSGSVGSLWSWLKYRGWTQRDRVPDVAKGSIMWLLSVSALGYLIIIADTWLHVTTSTELILQALPTPHSVSTFGRGFYSSNCGNQESYPCSVTTGSHGTGLIYGPEGFKTLANTSSQNRVLPFQYQGQLYSLITTPDVPQGTGYQAQTFAVNTQCTLISHECGLNMGPAGSTPFNCSAEFFGDLTDFSITSTNPSWGLAGVEFFQDPDLTANFSTVKGATMLGGSFTPANPVYIGAYGLVPGYGGGSSPLLNSTDFYPTQTQGLGFILGCNMTVYDLDFVLYNGNVSVQQMTLSNTSVVKVLTAPFVTKLANIANLAQSAAGEDTPSAFVESWTTGFSTMVLALSAGIMSPRANIMEQKRTPMLIARIPKAPLIALVFLNLIYAVGGVALAVLAARTGASETKSVKERVSVAGLAAKCFESTDRFEGPSEDITDLFTEKQVAATGHGFSKVSIVASERGGWRYDLITRDH
ncbi:hypothetical protein BGZ60DRAFT_127140 [Tricladium varicosporioides]|nr:hypothetical protein BGZ60DRAFT_127140 [Hymenoscyphus varicosporioides]